MCVGRPLEILSVLPGDRATVHNRHGEVVEVSTVLTPGVQVGHYVLVTNRVATEQVSGEAAKKTLALFAEIAASADEPGVDGAPLPLGAGPSRLYAHHQPEFL